MTEQAEPPCGLLVDWGGVLTTSVFDAFESFCAREGLEPGHVKNVFRADPEARAALAALEIGELTEEQFAERFAKVIGVDPAGLVDRMMADVRPDRAMLGAVRRARDEGILTGLISNSWGVARYDLDELRELFDGVVISGTVGVRKPDPLIYELGLRSIHLTGSECVYVDDLPGNLKPARALGMLTIHHTASGTTIGELSALFGFEL